MLVVHFIQGHLERYPKQCHCIKVNHRITQRKASMLWQLLVYPMSNLQNSVRSVQENYINQHFSFWVTAIWLTWLVSKLHRSQTSHFKLNVYLKIIHQHWINLDSMKDGHTWPKGFSFEDIIANFYSSDFSKINSETICI